MGRTPKPAELKEAQGNPGKRKIARGPEDDFSVYSGGTPRSLKGDAAKAWAKLAPELVRQKFLRETDVPAFMRYCSHLAEYARLTRAITKRGITYETNSRHVGRFRRINPDFLARERVENRLEALEDRFGLSPRARYQVIHHMMVSPAAQPPLPGLGDPEEQPAPGEPPQPGSAIGMLAGGAPRVH